MKLDPENTVAAINDFQEGRCKSRAEACRLYGLHPMAITRYAQAHGITLRDARKVNDRIEADARRRKIIAESYAATGSYAKTGRIFGISRQRVFQIVHREGGK